MLKKVNLDYLTTLVLDRNFMPTHVVSARHAFHCSFTNRVNPLDINKFPYEDYNQWAESALKSEDQPYINSALKKWPIPTIVLADWNMYGSSRNLNSSTGLFNLVKRYNYTCQITGKRFKKNWQKEFTREHVYPVSKGGSNEDFNVIITCREANLKKADTYPYYDHSGVDLSDKIKKFDRFSVWVPQKYMRKEWECFPQIKLYE